MLHTKLAKISYQNIISKGADRLSSVRCKDTPRVDFTDGVILTSYRCIEEDNFDGKLAGFVANSIDRILLKRPLSVFPLFVGFVCSVTVVFCC